MSAAMVSSTSAVSSRVRATSRVARVAQRGELAGGGHGAVDQLGRAGTSDDSKAPMARWPRRRRGERGAARPRAGAPRAWSRRAQIALVAGDGGARRLGPDEEVGGLAVPSLRGQGARDVHEGVGEDGELTEAGRPGRRARRGLAQRGGQRLAALVELAERDRLGGSAAAEGARGVPTSTSASSMPANASGSSSGRSIALAQALPRTSRCPARFPLSTVDT